MAAAAGGGGDKEANELRELSERQLQRYSSLPEKCRVVAEIAILLQNVTSSAVLNSAILRLGEAFERGCKDDGRGGSFRKDDGRGSNILRICILNALRTCRNQLHRVINADRLVRRVHSVFQSNDPEARTIALWVFNSLGPLIKHHHRIHSDVRDALASPNEQEQNACAYCIADLVARSPSMADVSLSAVSRIVMAVETRHSLRLVLMRGLSGMHHNPVMASQAAETIIQVMREYPTLDMTLECLRAMTRLTCRSRVCVDQCLELLVSTLKHDVRRGVRLQAARCLEQLSPTDYILWAVPIGEMMDAAEDAGSEISIAVSCMRPVKVLARQVGVNLERLKSTMHGSDGMGKSLLMRKLSAVALAGAADACAWGGKELAGQVLRCVHGLLPRKPPIDSTDQELVKCLSKLLRLEPSLAMQSVDSLLPLLRSEGHEGVGLACRAFASCAAVCRDAGDRALEALMSELVRGECSSTARQYILRSSMQVSSSSVTRWRVCGEAVAAASRQMLDADPWVGYKLGKYAMANGGHEVARGLLEELYSRVETSNYKAWLGFLTALATAEEACHKGDRGGAIESLRRAQTQFRASVPGGGGLTGHGSVQEGFLRARLQFLDAVVEIKAAAWGWLDDSEWDSGIGRDLVTQAVKTARDCVGVLKLLERSRLGVDTISISCFQQLCLCLSLIADSAEHLLLGAPLPLEPAASAQSLLPLEVLDECRSLVEIMNESRDKSAFARVEVIIQVADSLMGLPLRVPPVVLLTAPPQIVRVKTVPAAKTVSEFVEANTLSDFVLRLEASMTAQGEEARRGKVDRDEARAGAFDVRKVVLRVCASAQDDLTATKEVAWKKQVTYTLKCRGGTASASCLFRFPSPGIYSVSIVPGLQDADGHEWDAGSGTVVRVKVTHQQAPLNSQQQSHQYQQQQQQQQQQRAPAAPPPIV